MANFNSSTPGIDTENFSSDCNVYEKADYDVALVALSIAMGLFGLVYTFVGYRCFKAVMFLSGLIFGGAMVYIICQEERIVQHNLSSGAIIGISVGIGVLCGLITMLVIYVGLFLQGVFLGVLLAIGAILALSKFYHPTTPWIPLGILFGTGVLFALFTLKWQKLFLVIGTSVMGAAMLCTCLQYFLGKFSLHRYIWVKLMAKPSEEECWFFVVILGLWPALSLLGILIQWKFTGKGYDHTDVIIWRDQRERIRTHLVRQPTRTPSMDPLTSQQVRQRPGNRQSSFQGNSGRHRGQLSQPRRNDGIARTASENAAANFDTLPPSYDDCMKHGIGKPVKESDRSRIVRTKHGSFLSPATGDPEAGCSEPRTHLERATENERMRGGGGGTTNVNIIPGRHRVRQRGAGRHGNNAPVRSESDRRPRDDRRSRERRSASNETPRRGSNRASGRSGAAREQRPTRAPDDRQSLLHN